MARSNRRMSNRGTSFILLLVSTLFMLTTPFSAKAFLNLDDLKDSEDGALDLSYWLAEKKGFLPLLMPITEPAVGYGLVVAPMFFHQSIAELQSEAGKTPTGKTRPPSITAVGGMATENGTWGFAGGHMGVWADDRLRYLGGAGGASVNLTFHGMADAFRDDGFDYTLKGAGIVQELTARLGKTDFFAGLRYTFFRVKSRFELETNIPGVEEREFTSNNGGLGITLGYDSRDNIFTPNRGIHVKVRPTFYDNTFGGDFNYQKIEGFAIGYLDLHPKVVLGLRLDGRFSFGDVPFYALPFIDLRGVPVMRYQGEDAVVAEVEARWNFYRRWSVVGFLGAGTVTEKFDELDRRPNVSSQGIGIRYRIARLFGLDAGIDVAHSSDGWAFYIQIGSGWARSL